MALKKQILHIQVNRADGTSFTLDGDAAQQFLQQWASWNRGGSPKSFTFENAEGNREHVSYRCICGVIELPNTQEDIDDPECGDADCIPDYVPAPPAS